MMKRDAETMTWHFGALCPKLIDQLAADGFKPKPEDRKALAHIQKDHDAAVRLHVRQLLTDREYNAVLNRIGRSLGKLFSRKGTADET
jgi:hypothetical protein